MNAMLFGLFVALALSVSGIGGLHFIIVIVSLSVMHLVEDRVINKRSYSKNQKLAIKSILYIGSFFITSTFYINYSRINLNELIKVSLFIVLFGMLYLYLEKGLN